MLGFWRRPSGITACVLVRAVARAFVRGLAMLLFQARDLTFLPSLPSLILRTYERKGGGGWVETPTSQILLIGVLYESMSEGGMNFDYPFLLTGECDPY